VRGLGDGGAGAGREAVPRRATRILAKEAVLVYPGAGPLLRKMTAGPDFPDGPRADALGSAGFRECLLEPGEP
jgi:hypothetical protein